MLNYNVGYFAWFLLFRTEKWDDDNNINGDGRGQNWSGLRSETPGPFWSPLVSFLQALGTGVVHFGTRETRILTRSILVSFYKNEETK